MNQGGPEFIIHFAERESRVGDADERWSAETIGTQSCHRSVWFRIQMVEMPAVEGYRLDGIRSDNIHGAAPKISTCSDPKEIAGYLLNKAPESWKWTENELEVNWKRTENELETNWKQTENELEVRWRCWIILFTKVVWLTVTCWPACSSHTHPGPMHTRLHRLYRIQIK